MASRKVEEMVERHLTTINIPRGLESDTKEMVSKMIQHPAFGNQNYQWSLDDFELGKRLGRGKFGRVFQAREKGTGFVVALKTLIKAEIVKGHVEKQVMREIEIQSHLKHPNILEMLAWFHDSHRIYLILEYAGKGEIYNILKSQPNQRFDEKQTAKLIYQVADALHYCHQNEVIHRDLKPENLLMTITGDVKLADFGWSVHTPSLHRQTMCGTIDYLPPEMVTHTTYGHTVDNWCLGVLCYEFLHGRPPFEGPDEDVTYKRIKLLNFSYAPYISSGARHLIDSLLVLDHGKRLSLPDVMKHPWIVQHYQR